MRDPRPRTTSPARALLADAVAVLGVLLVLGIAVGLIWPELVGPVQTGRAGTEAVPARQFDVDGWYVVLAALAGSVAGAALTLWRRRDPVATVLLLVGGAGLAAWATARLGARADLEVRALAAYLVWPLAVTFGAVVVLWTRHGSHPDDR